MKILGSHTNVTFQLANRSIKHPIGIIENAVTRVKSFFIPVNYIVLDMKEDMHLPIILCRPFLTIVRALIDVKKIN